MENYTYIALTQEPSVEEIRARREDGWELCGAPDGEIGRELAKEPTYPHSRYYFRKPI